MPSKKKVHGCPAKTVISSKMAKKLEESQHLLELINSRVRGGRMLKGKWVITRYLQYCDTHKLLLVLTTLKTK